MDIEVAEMSVLIGAQDILAEGNTICAICVYRRPEDLWQIPLLFSRWMPDSYFYLRMYEACGLDTVFYAVPQKYGMQGRRE